MSAPPLTRKTPMVSTASSSTTAFQRRKSCEVASSSSSAPKKDISLVSSSTDTSTTIPTASPTPKERFPSTNDNEKKKAKPSSPPLTPPIKSASGSSSSASFGSSSNKNKFGVHCSSHHAMRKFMHHASKQPANQFVDAVFAPAPSARTDLNLLDQKKLMHEESEAQRMTYLDGVFYSCVFRKTSDELHYLKATVVLALQRQLERGNVAFCHRLLQIDKKAKHQNSLAPGGIDKLFNELMVKLLNDVDIVYKCRGYSVAQNALNQLRLWDDNFETPSSPNQRKQKLEPQN